MNTLSIDLNCDLGEGLDSDKDIIPFISSANIACGYHAGDEATMRTTVAYCLEHKVAIGAHPGFDDRQHFGRTEMKLDEGEIYNLVGTQVKLIRTIAEEMGAVLHHVKPHGALYNMAAVDPVYARAMARAVKDIDARLLFYGLSNSEMIHAAEHAGLQAVSEVFADRSYQSNGQLTPRSQPGALLHDTEAAVQQVLQLLREGTVRSLSGEMVSLRAETVCLHGDGPQALALARGIRQQLMDKGINIEAIASTVKHL